MESDLPKSTTSFIILYSRKQSRSGHEAQDSETRVIIYNLISAGLLLALFGELTFPAKSSTQFITFARGSGPDSLYNVSPIDYCSCVVQKLSLRSFM